MYVCMCVCNEKNRGGLMDPNHIFDASHPRDGEVYELLFAEDYRLDNRLY